MKKTTAVVVLFTLVFAGAFGTFAQSKPTQRNIRLPQNFVQFQDVVSYSDGQGAYIRWQMAFETRNLGFYVYRVTPGGYELVDQNMVGGFATKVSVPTGYGEKYEYYDPQGTFGTVYAIQAICADGRRAFSDTVRPKASSNFELDTGHPKAFWEQVAGNTNGELQRTNLGLTKELKTTVSESVLPPDINTHRWVVAQPGAKIAVKEDGMYRVLRTELEAAGFNVNTNSANWRLFMEGNEQAILIGAGDQFIEFYGRGTDTPESDTRYYYLINDSVAGKRMESKLLSNIGGPITSQSYRAVSVFKERTQYNSNIKNGEAESYWGRAIVDASPNPPIAYQFSIGNIDAAIASANINVRIQGLQIFGTPIMHSVRVKLNGVELGFVNGPDQENFAADFPIATSLLIEGTNTLEFIPTTGNDFSYLDTVTVSYSRKYVAQGNRLQFYTPGYRRAEVTNFTAPNVRVFDVTYDGNPQLITNVPVIDNGGGQFSVKLPSDRAAVFYAIDKSAMLQSPAVSFNHPSTLASDQNTAQVIIISHSASDFMSVAQSWGTYRQSASGGAFNVKVVDVADIFDEFNYGTPSAAALTAFLENAGNVWQTPKPEYVLLLGDGSYDPRNYEGFGSWNLIPIKAVNLVFQESASDEAIADFNHDGRAEMTIGRVPARNSFQLSTVFNKTQGFETPAMQNLDARGSAFAHDCPLGFDFEAMNLALRSELGSHVPATFVRRCLGPPNPANEPDPQAQANLLSALNLGPYIVNYAGHGSAGVWGATSFFSLTDVSQLANSSNQSLYTMLTCFNGYFIRPNADSLAEALLFAPNGGGAATWASTTETTPDLQMLMGSRFYNQVGAGNIKRIGGLVADAKTAVPSGDVAYSWVLLGDPVMKVRQ